MATDDYLSIGKICGAHGVNGNLKVHPYADDLSTIDIGTRLFLKGRADHQETPITVTGWRPHGRVFLLSCEEITSRNQADKAVGGELVILRSDLPDPGEDTYYWVDIIGLAVYTEADVCIGRVRSILPTGSNDVYLVYDDESGKETLIPAIRSVVKKIDPAGGRIRVDVTDLLD